MTTESQKITAFHGIFENRLKGLIKRIKELRKQDPSNKQQLKTLLSEAKNLRKIIKKDKKQKQQYTIQIPINGELNGEPDTSGPIKINDVRLVGGLLVVDYELI